MDMPFDIIIGDYILWDSDLTATEKMRSVACISFIAVIILTIS
jgi:hypothetical protein